jgi:hypothetical protein
VIFSFASLAFTSSSILAAVALRSGAAAEVVREKQARSRQRKAVFMDEKTRGKGLGWRENAFGVSLFHQSSVFYAALRHIHRF